MTRVAVIGVGLSGILVGKALGKLGVEIEYFGNQARAQWHPAALVHPFPGRSLTLTPEVRDALQVLSRWMTHELPGRPVWVERPLPQGSREFRSYMSSCEDYPPWLQHSLEGECLRYRPAWVVDMATIPAPEITSETVDWVRAGQESLVGFESTEKAFDAVVICPGRDLQDWWDVQSVEQGGEAVLTHQHVQQEDVASCGPAHLLPWQDGMALSKSFLAPGQIRTDYEVIEDFEKRSGLTLTGSKIWRGVRCISHDRQPLCGELLSNVFLLGALGARGLLLGPALAENLARLIVEGKDEIPQIFSVRRAPGRAGVRLRPGTA